LWLILGRTADIAMPPSETLRVFISYAQKDGAPLAQRLQSDLAKEGLDKGNRVIPVLAVKGGDRPLPAVEEFTKRVGEGTRAAWLRPLQPTLHPPGTALIRTPTGHTSYVSAVGVTPDGERAVSASYGETLKLWDFGNRRSLCHLHV
jgi:WD40 repeat protein